MRFESAVGFFFVCSHTTGKSDAGACSTMVMREVIRHSWLLYMSVGVLNAHCVADSIGSKGPRECLGTDIFIQMYLLNVGMHL